MPPLNLAMLLVVSGIAWGMALRPAASQTLPIHAGLWSITTVDTAYDPPPLTPSQRALLSPKFQADAAAAVAAGKQPHTRLQCLSGDLADYGGWTKSMAERHCTLKVTRSLATDYSAVAICPGTTVPSTATELIQRSLTLQSASRFSGTLDIVRATLPPQDAHIILDGAFQSGDCGRLTLKSGLPQPP